MSESFKECVDNKRNIWYNFSRNLVTEEDILVIFTANYQH